MGFETSNAHYEFMVTIRILGFSNQKFWLKKPNLDKGQKTLGHFGQVNFNMSNVTRVVFLTSKVKTI
jgi:hypothetical protein